MLLALRGAVAITGFAQDAPGVPVGQETVELPVFEVRETPVGAYGAREATAINRISTPLVDIAQSVSVVTRALMDDTHGLRLVDVARFATPILENNNGAGDAYTLRGFRTLQRFVDGVQIGAQGNSMWSDLTNMERMEIVKGPNAILVPGANYGGKVNLITKSPRFGEFTHLTFHLRTYLGNEVSLDANRRFDANRSAARMVFSRWDSKGYFHGQFRRGWLVAPSFAHRFSNHVDLIVKLETLENKESNLMGVAIDPAVGTRVGLYARKHPLLPRDNMWPPEDEYRSHRETRVTSELRFPIGGTVAARLWLMADHVFFVTPNPDGARHDAPLQGLQGSRDPLTGQWEPFKEFTYDAATGAVSSTNLVPTSSTEFTRLTHQIAQEHYDEVHLKNDYAAQYPVGSAGQATTIGGVSANWLPRVDSKAWRVNRDSVDYSTGRPVGPDEPATIVLTRDKKAEQRDIQVFVYQRFNLMDDRLIVSAGVAEFFGDLERLDDSLLPEQLEQRTTRNKVTDWNLGLIYKPGPEVSFFAGYNRVGGALPLSTSAGEYRTDSFKVGVGDQRELGVKTSWLRDHVATSAAYFEIVQENVQRRNSAYQADPIGQPRYFFFDLANRGFEAEVSALFTPSFEVVGNFTHMHMRDSYGVPVLMVPDAAGAVFAKYTIRVGTWEGLGVSLGADYLGRRPGSSSEPFRGETLFTVAGVRNQPSFYLAPRTLLQAGISYRNEHWSLSVTVHNLTNKDDFRAAANRYSMEPGEPRNYSATLELRW